MKKFTKIMAAVVAATAITISAGSMSASACMEDLYYDSGLLHTIGLCPTDWDDSYTLFHWEEVSKDVDAAWARGGVTVVSKPIYPNEYYIDGKRVSQKDAYIHVVELTGKKVEIGSYFPSDTTNNS